MDTKYSIVEKKEQDIKKEEDALELYLEEEEEITKKVPYTNFPSIPEFLNNRDDKVPFVKIVVLSLKADYQDFYAIKHHAIILKMESEKAWFGVPCKIPNIDPIEWDKIVWEKIYEFNLTLDMFPTL